jgi:hypothetical protein
MLLSLERLFSSVQEVLAHADRDPYARQVFFFAVIDQLEGLRFDSWENMLSPRKARDALVKLQATLPEGVAEVLLWRCGPAVAALEEIRDGMGPASRVRDGLIAIRNDRGGLDRIKLDIAVSRYLRVLRNSAHSFREAAAEPRHFSILASVLKAPPNAVADLALLHLVRFLEDPRVQG